MKVREKDVSEKEETMERERETIKKRRERRCITKTGI
jgi:hypothetical protein